VQLDLQDQHNACDALCKNDAYYEPEPAALDPAALQAAREQVRDTPTAL
jgi:hypothetical protein